eukprot:CAMPEP_0113569524 /NCGR_PEP_ID=MMETSP0015_2-20120614/24460_1 /TAXON_ID=2838 /ORGANISM="Odontella" /LENGTH=242 /DNA_ID=CAMNT_0000472201 /DNA_START=118 /DNA_END=843 /DNA_ORIENTATION=- /assembly_acc=CAM_ASM_000160
MSAADLAMVALENFPPPPDDAASVATTVVDFLASEVGSVVGAPKDAFQRSVTFFKDLPRGLEWDIRFADPPKSTGGYSSWRRRKREKQQLITVDSIGGVVALSRIQVGDVLKKINGKRIGPSYSAERAEEFMEKCLEEEGVLSITVGNDDGDDVLVQATIIQPKSDMTYEDLGLMVWFWGVLCIKSIAKDSLFRHTVLKSNDRIISINDILCDELEPDQVAKILTELPEEITIIVKRRKERW